jgi:hypothetical protein
VPESDDKRDCVETAWKRVSTAGKERLRANRRSKRA